MKLELAEKPGFLEIDDAVVLESFTSSATITRRMTLPLKLKLKAGPGVMAKIQEQVAKQQNAFDVVGGSPVRDYKFDLTMVIHGAGCWISEVEFPEKEGGDITATIRVDAYEVEFDLK